MTPLGDRWKAFLTMVFDPLSVGLLVPTIFLSIVLVLQTDRIIIAIFTFLVAVFSGVLGGVLGKKWDDLTGERIIIARGKSAIRSLKLLLGSAVALERRVRQHLGQCAEENKKKRQALETITIHLEEVIGRCVLLEEGILSSIESWTDIIPEADVKTQIGLISELTSKVENLVQELSALSTELQETKGKSEEEINKLKADKRQKEKELSELRHELSGRTIGIGLPLTAGTASLGSGSVLAGTGTYHVTQDSIISYPGKRSCISCRKEFESSSGFVEIQCPECRNKPLGLTWPAK